ncbi:MAG: hypothetical protein IJF98_04620 [Firmicutes bacterium]|nr:hypothetical protein [Bacillota bacterium]
MKKRFFAVFIAGVMVCALPGCGKEAETAETAAEKVEQTAEEAEEQAEEAAETAEEIIAEETEGDAPADQYSDMPLGTYESAEMAREVTIFADGTFEMLGGHGVEDPEPFTGTWEQTTIDMGDEMYADGLKLFMDGEEFMEWIWDGERFIVGPWEGEDAQYEHMIRTKGPVYSIDGEWYAFEGGGLEIDGYRFEKGSWEAFDDEGDTVESGTYTAGADGENSYVLADEDGVYYDEGRVYEDNIFGNTIKFKSGGAYFGSDSEE